MQTSKDITDINGTSIYSYVQHAKELALHSVGDDIRHALATFPRRDALGNKFTRGLCRFVRRPDHVSANVFVLCVRLENSFSIRLLRLSQPKPVRLQRLRKRHRMMHV